MNLAAIYHRPESEMAYLYDDETMHIRLRTARADIAAVSLIAGDPYSLRSLPQVEPFYKRPVPMQLILSDAQFDYWQISVTEPKRRLGYAFFITDTAGETVLYTDKGFVPATDAWLMDMNTYFRMPFFQTIDAFHAPEWVKQTVWYQIFPERFANGDVSNDPVGTKSWRSTDHPGRQDYYGGDLQGILDHLDHLVTLGVNGIYLNPIFKAPSNHKYDTQDYLEIDPDFGDKALFKAFVTAAHARGIRVMLDAVFNHMGDTAPEWQDVMTHGADSKYAQWFHIHEFPVTYTATDNFEFAADATYDTFDYTPHMPKLNTANPEVQAYLLNIATYWIREFDIDAWRLDVANEISHDFWKRFKQATTALKPDFYILGEIWHNSQAWLNGDEFSAVMNYTYTGAILDYFIHHKITATAMMDQLNQQLMRYRDQTNQMMFNALDSHDTPRIKTLAGDDMDLVQQVLAFTFIQPGVPSIYYGTEYGMTGENDPDDRKPMVWEPALQDQAMFAFMQRLIRFRRGQAPLLSEGTLTWHIIKTDVVALTRTLGKQQLRAVFNAGTQAEPLAVTNVLLANQYESQHLAPHGFVIYQN